MNLARQTPIGWSKRHPSPAGEDRRAAKRRRTGERRPHGAQRLFDDLWRRIVRYLSVEEIGEVLPRVSRRFARLSSEHRLKRELLTDRFGLMVIEEGGSTRAGGRGCVADNWDRIARHFAGITLVDMRLAYTLRGMVQLSSDVHRGLRALPRDFERFYVEIRLVSNCPRSPFHTLHGLSRPFSINGIPLCLSISLTNTGRLQMSLPVYTPTPAPSSPSEVPASAGGSQAGRRPRIDDASDAKRLQPAGKRELEGGQRLLGGVTEEEEEEEEDMAAMISSCCDLLMKYEDTYAPTNYAEERGEGESLRSSAAAAAAAAAMEDYSPRSVSSESSESSFSSSASSSLPELPLPYPPRSTLAAACPPPLSISLVADLARAAGAPRPRELRAAPGAMARQAPAAEAPDHRGKALLLVEGGLREMATVTTSCDCAGHTEGLLQGWNQVRGGWEALSGEALLRHAASECGVLRMALGVRVVGDSWESAYCASDRLAASWRAFLDDEDDEDDEDDDDDEDDEDDDDDDDYSRDMEEGEDLEKELEEDGGGYGVDASS
eukprot:CAMPEP_0167776746 /NCGR_PEP_ID=MMETSP0111_2-20121227/3295_1 /TAXON_ID=91324 /ORGANISM="Lotharella globosa, Strain CCCM811" /LENGTH=548 /DNA_ID=CAMNT_0007666825 /DNA_START=1 /DNA_END=1649 /DNA_ORIENTATION=+